MRCHAAHRASTKPTTHARQRRYAVAVCANAGKDIPSEGIDSSSAQGLRKGFGAPHKREQQLFAQEERKTAPESAAGIKGLGNNIVLGGDVTEETWRAMDKKVNKYPGFRTFTAIGTGGAEFKLAMIEAVVGVVGSPLHPECISDRLSSKGQFVSVRLGPVHVQTPEQVIEIYSRMKTDSRLKWFM